MTEALRPTAIIADDHPVYREGVARALRDRSGLELVGEAGDALGALALIRHHRPTVAVLDLRMPELPGLQLLARAREVSPATRLAVLSGYHDPETVYEALEAGAATYLSKGDSRRIICETVERVARGEVVFSAPVQEALTAELQPRPDVALLPALTRREQEVLTLCADGLRAPAIAAQLQLGTATVKTHLTTMYRKLGARDRAAAVANGYRLGLVS